MKRSILVLALLTAAAQVAAPAPSAHAQSGPFSFNSGIKIRGDFHVNRSSVKNSEELPEQEIGYGLGLELNGNKLGLGLYGYTAGQAQSFDSETTPVIVVAEANYFLPVEALRIAPYAGVHTALGEFTKDYLKAPHLPKPQDGLREIGYQVGLRFRPLPLVGLDVQWRKQSRFAQDNQDASLEATQVLVGFTVF